LAGGINPVSHMVSVGYASEAEMEVWADSLMGNADWAACIGAVRSAADPLGATLSRTVKTWGSVSLADLTVP
jgi:hypothetical protein